jgi:SAM-dependent methyltransferase
LSESDRASVLAAESSDRENGFKNFFKRWPRTYRIISLIVSPVLLTGLTIERFTKRFTNGQRMLNVGSGPTNVHPNCLNVDFYPFPNVDVIANAEHLPFADQSFDVVCSDQLLEHVADPARVISEMLRVLKLGGWMYVGVPFIFPLHPSPKDYFRWSIDGMEALLSGCKLVESGVAIGPTSGMLTVLSSWLAIACSFGLAPLRKTLHYVFMLALNPLKLLDLIFARLPGARTIAAGVYVVVRKI